MAKRTILNRFQLHKRSVTETNGIAKMPQPSQIEYGEIAINYAAGNEKIWIKNNSGNVVGFSRTNVKTVQPSGGMLPNVVYNFGELTGNTTFSINTTNVDSTILNHYFFTFSIGSTIPTTVNYPSGISWVGNEEPILAQNTYYEVSIINNRATFMEC